MSDDTSKQDVDELKSHNVEQDRLIYEIRADVKHIKEDIHRIHSRNDKFRETIGKWVERAITWTIMALLAFWEFIIGGKH